MGGKGNRRASANQSIVGKLMKRFVGCWTVTYDWVYSKPEFSE